MMRRRLLNEGARSPYIFIEWLSTNGNQYINTGIIPTADMSVECEYSLNNTYTNDQVMIGCRNNTNNTFFIELYRASQWYAGVSTVRYNKVLNNVGNSLNQKHKVTLTANALTVDNTSAQPTATQAGTVTVPIYIFAYNDNNASTPIWRTNTTQIYNVKLYENNILTHNYLPAIRTADNKPGLYDSVTDTFLTNQGWGDFITP